MSAHRQPFPLLDDLVDVDDAPVRGAWPSARATVVLPAAMNRRDKPCQLSLRQPAQCVEETRIRNRDGVGAVDRRRALGGQRGDRERHRHPVIAARVGDCRLAGRRPSGRRSTNPSGRSSASRPSARKPATSAAMRSLSLTRSSPAPLTLDLTAVGARAPRSPAVRRSAREFPRARSRGAGRGRVRRQWSPAARRRPSWSTGHRRARRTAQHVEQGRPRRIEADVLDFDARAGNGRRRDQPEGRRGEVAGHGELAAGQALAAW